MLQFIGTAQTKAYSQSPSFTLIIPAGEMLNPDGTLNLHPGASGSLALAGCTVALDPRRGPVFTRAGKEQIRTFVLR